MYLLSFAVVFQHGHYSGPDYAKSISEENCDTCLPDHPYLQNEIQLMMQKKKRKKEKRS